MPTTALPILDPLTPLTNDPSLSPVAHLCISAGTLLLENGASGRVVNEAVTDIATGQGCEFSEVLCHHAAVLVMIHRGSKSCMQMSKAAEHVVNLRRIQAVRQIIRELGAGKLNCAVAQERMDSVMATTAAYPVWVVCVATGIACSAFGQLLGADLPSFLPTFVGSACGQWVRHKLFHSHHNIFVIAAAVSFFSASIAGTGARLCQSVTVPLATVAAVLLLVPGIAVLNAQVDILEGKPNLAAARALRVLYLLLFMALGLAFAQALVLPHP